jgi:hypothetical protein
MSFWIDLGSRDIAKTRTEFRCPGCYDIVKPGSKAYICKGVGDDGFMAVRLCSPCAEEMHKQFDEEPYEDIDFYDLGYLRAEREHRNGSKTSTL